MRPDHQEARRPAHFYKRRLKSQVGDEEAPGHLRMIDAAFRSEAVKARIAEPDIDGAEDQQELWAEP